MEISTCTSVCLGKELHSHKEGPQISETLKMLHTNWKKNVALIFRSRYSNGEIY